MDKTGETVSAAGTQSDHVPDLLLFDNGGPVAKNNDLKVEMLDAFVVAGGMALLKRHAFRYRDVAIRTVDVGLMRKPLNKAVLARLLARRKCWLEDGQGTVCELTVPQLTRLLVRRLVDSAQGAFAIRHFRRRVSMLERWRRTNTGRVQKGAGPVLYLRTDLVFGLRSGGSVGHIAGVLNSFHSLCGNARFYSTDGIPTVDDSIDVTIVRPDARYGDFPEIRASLFGARMAEVVAGAWQGEVPGFIYQRYAVNNITGVLLARRFQVPFVVEYNGSEVWINRHWGKVLDNESLALKVEMLNLVSADLVVVVSKVLAAELVDRGVCEERILVNPNGVDPVRYRPEIRGSDVRVGLHLDDQLVVGFVGTFGPWHGAEVLASAAVMLLTNDPALRDRVRFLFIGDGQAMPTVRRMIRDGGVEDCCRFTGLVEQEAGPEYMAACDVLVSPHVPNPDGSAFFGSPTKLFEYMAMGRPIIASDLEQIGEVLTNGQDALLVPPGDAAAITEAIVRLLDERDLGIRLGRAARKAVLQRFTWERHTQRILAKLDELLDAQFG